MTTKTIFEQIIDGEIQTSKIYEDDKVIVINDIAPQAPIHYLIIPKKHFSKIQEINESDLSIVAHVYRIAQIIASDQDIHDYRIIVNNGKKAGQTVFHVHFHFLAGSFFEKLIP
jgi:histidine triad (HIT) family protein